MCSCSPAFCGTTTPRLSWSSYHCETISSSPSCLPGTQTSLDRPALSGAPPQFGTFGSAGHSKPYISSSQYAAGIWLEQYHSLAAFAFFFIASSLGDFLCREHTFRLAKYIRNTDSTQSYLALFTIRNEYMHIVAYYFTHTTSLVELQ